jgi:hypothetical protein
MLRLRAEIAGVKKGQLEVLALLVCIDAAGPEIDHHGLVNELRTLLLANGFPSAPALEQKRLQLGVQLESIAQRIVRPEFAGAATRLDNLQRASAAVAVRNSLAAGVEAAKAELQRMEQYSASVNAAQPPSPTGTDVDRLRLLTGKDAVNAELQAAVRAESDSAGVDTARKTAEADVTAARTRLQAAQDKELAARTEMAEQASAITAAVQSVPVPAEQLYELLQAQKRELDEATRAEGKVQAEREAYQNADAAKLALDAAKAAEKRAKEAGDKCLRESLGAVAEAFQPFCALLGGSWRLGDDRPLGLERDGRWIDFELLSESERLVYGIGLVLALSTLGKGLRLVMLDGLDSCDVDRRRAIVTVARTLVAAGKLDNVLGTAWSSAGFEAAQVIEV